MKNEELEKAIKKQRKLLVLLTLLPQRTIKEKGLRGKLFCVQAEIQHILSAR